MSRYNFQDIEKKWQKSWEDNKSFKTVINKKKEILLPRNVSLSVRKIHMGHVRNYTIGDVLARYKGLAVLMSYILWDGTLLACQQKMLLEIII